MRPGSHGPCGTQVRRPSLWPVPSASHTAARLPHRRRTTTRSTRGGLNWSLLRSRRAWAPGGTRTLCTREDEQIELGDAPSPIIAANRNAAVTTRTSRTGPLGSRRSGACDAPRTCSHLYALAPRSRDHPRATPGTTEWRDGQKPATQLVLEAGWRTGSCTCWRSRKRYGCGSRGWGLRAVSRRTGLDRKTVRRYVEAGVAAGLTQDGDRAIGEEVLGRVVVDVAPGGSTEIGQMREECRSHRDLLEGWVNEGCKGPKLMKLLARHTGIQVPLRTLQRYITEELSEVDRGTVRVVDGARGGLPAPRRVHGRNVWPTAEDARPVVHGDV